MREIFLAGKEGVTSSKELGEATSTCEGSSGAKTDS